MTRNQLLILTIACFVLAALIPSGGGGLPFVPSTGEVSIAIVEETAERSLLPESQLSILNSTVLRDWAQTHCDKGAGGSPEFRVLDVDADVSNMPEKWREIVARAKGQSLPYLAVSTGRSGAEGDLPLTEAETMAVLRRYAGD
jgi:hypothetical protein